MENSVRDISTQEAKETVAVIAPYDLSVCETLKEQTSGRICIGKAGARLRTETYLRFRADHAVANDAALSHANEEKIDEIGFYKVQTKCQDKDEYLTRPDLGRTFSDETLNMMRDKCATDIDVQIIAGDGLSAAAIPNNIGDIYPMILDGVKDLGYSVGTPIYVKYARVAAMDYISEVVRSKVTIILIGERPGLATGDSLSAYMAYESSPNKPESQRTVVSNIHKYGMTPVEAGAQIVSIINKMMIEKKSGIDLKL